MQGAPESRGDFAGGGLWMIALSMSAMTAAAAAPAATTWASRCAA